MSTTLLSPVAEEAELRKEEAQAHWKNLLEARTVVSTSSLRIGYNAAHLKRNNLFGVLGFEDEHAARKAAEVGESTWYANIRIAEHFPGVTEKTFCLMKQANAKELCDLPESKRLTPYWLQLAATEKIERFAELVDEELNGNARESDSREPTKTFKQTMPASRLKLVEEGLKDFAAAVGIDKDRALEIMVEEHRQAPSLLTAITHAIERIGEIKRLRESLLSSDEVLEKAMEELNAMAQEFELAVIGVQNLESE
jgi:hypothetical protein